ncbi:hypothetical protein CFC21_079156 [Triticum aestivum]|uniref:Uncharacterized protein n=2 Tax=Triticum aestivum TaxID=4565 RepID=A0A3B6MVE1_WHEAT|nr:hypothetical protein CFC21_079156 [Triticum aestivum]
MLPPLLLPSCSSAMLLLLCCAAAPLLAPCDIVVYQNVLNVKCTTTCYRCKCSEAGSTFEMVAKNEMWAAKDAATRARAVDESKKYKRSLVEIGVMLSISAIYILLSFLVPGMSWQHQIMCWQNAMMAFAFTMMFTWMHLRTFRWSIHKTELPLV